ncbi:MAG: hypothetical protein MJZ53_02760 [Paludibacteraceae bacterium]|nr:hypothetical protein [Paludibacteraceae bacterium]
MKKVLFLSVALCCALISFAKPGIQTRKSMLQASICQEDSSYTYKEGILTEKMYFTYNVDGILSQILYLENESETWVPYLLDIVYENGLEVKNIWSWKVGEEWFVYEEDEYFYNENGEQTGHAIYDVTTEGVKTGRECKNIVIEGNTTSDITYKWEDGNWVVNYKTDVITEGNTETTISYRPGLIPMNKTVIERLDGGAGISTMYRYNSETEGWDPSSKTEYDNYDRPTQSIAYRYNEEWIYTNKVIYEYVGETDALSNVKTYAWDSSLSDWNLNREEVYEYDGKGNNIVYISKGYMGGVISFGNKTVNEYNEVSQLLSSITYGWDAVAADFVTPQSKSVNEFDDFGNCTFFASYSWNSEASDWYATSKNEFEYDENNNLTLERYYFYDWLSSSLYIGQETHHYYSCEETSIDQTKTDMNQGTSKVIMNGAIYIIKNGMMYSAHGQIIK